MNTLFSNELAFNLMENFLLGIQSKDIDRIVKQFHPEIEFRGHPSHPIIGLEAFKHSSEILLSQIESYNFKLKQVLWDPQLLTGTATIEYEALTKIGGKRIYEIAIFTLKDDLINYVIYAGTLLSEW
jgi:isopropylmalate/homocitrate/citramalate synthase